MIIVAIIALSLVVITAIAAVFVGLPTFPSTVTSMMDMFVSILQQGAGVFWAFVLPDVVKAEITFTLAIIVIYEAYKLVMWVMTKIPMFGVSD